MELLPLIELTPLQYAAALAIVVFAGIVQGAVGFGMGVLGVPVLLMIDPSLIPGTFIVLGSFLPILMLIREHPSLDRRGLAFALAGHLPGALAGSQVLRALPERPAIIMCHVLVLVAVGLSLRGLHFKPTRRATAGAGMGGGFMSAICGIAGPPIALVYQNSDGPRIRATLSAYFLCAAFLTAGSLATVGRFGTSDVIRATMLLPAVVVGFVISRLAARWLDRGLNRSAVLAVSAVMALAGIVQTLSR